MRVLMRPRRGDLCPAVEQRDQFVTRRQASIILDGETPACVIVPASPGSLPSLKELASIVDDTLTSPAISPLFTDRPSSAFWSSSPAVPDSAYAIDFTTGASFNITVPFATLLHARCVR